MHFFSFTLKVEADVVSVRYLSNLFQNVVPWEEIVFSPYSFVFIFARRRSFLYLVSWSCIWSFRQKISLMASSSKV